MQVKGTPKMEWCRASELADLYGVTVEQANMLKTGEPFEVEDNIADALVEAEAATLVKE
jgi:hypothetical protein